MRTSVSFLMLALCIVAFECTITANTEETGRVDNVQSDVVVTKTTTTAAQKPLVKDLLTVQDDVAPAAPIAKDDPQEEAEVPEEEELTHSSQKDPQAPPPAVRTTTNTPENKGNTEGPLTLTADAHSSSSGSHNPSHSTPPAGRESGTPDHSLTERGQQVQNSQLEEVKTTTTAVPAPSPKLLLKGKEKPDDDKTLSQHQTELEGNADERTNIAGPTVSKGPPSTGLQTITQPKGKDEDHSNGDREGTIQGRVNPQQVAAASTTTTTANKPSPKLPAPITDNVLTPALQAKGSSKTSTGVQKQVTPIKPADPTESQKQIGAKATTTTTTKPATVNTQTGAALTTATITTDKQTASTENTTPSTVAPNNTLPKGFNIPQSLDKMDGSYSTSLLFAFATVATFTVIAVTPVY